MFFVVISLEKYRGGAYQGFVKHRLDTVVSGVEMFLFPFLKDSLQKWI